MLTAWFNYIAGQNCIFPSDWQDHWFSGSVGEVVITSSDVTAKGHCVASVNNYYLLEDK